MSTKATSYAVQKADQQREKFAAQATSVQAAENMETAPKRLEDVMQIQQAWSQSRTAEQAQDRMGVQQDAASQAAAVSFSK